MKKLLMFILPITICFAFVITISFVNIASADEDETVTVHIDAGFGEFNVLMSPHTIDTPATLGQKYPDTMFTQPPHKKGDTDYYYWTFAGYYYYDKNSNKVQINEDSIVTKEGLNLFCDWKENHPDECRYVRVIGSKNGHSLFHTECTDYVAGITSKGISTVYEDQFERDYCKDYKLYYEIAIHPKSDIYWLHVCCTDHDGNLALEKWWKPVAINDALAFKYWIVNDVVVLPNTKYEIDLFNPALNDINAIAVYDNSIINTCVSGGDGHSYYDVSYDCNSESWNKQLDRFTIDTVLLPDAFYEPKFSYRWNSLDGSLDISYSYLKDVNRTQHYKIKPQGKELYVLDEWSINGKKINKDIIGYIDLLSMFDSKITDLNINSLYKAVPSPEEPVNYDSSQLLPLTTEPSKTGDYNYYAIFLLTFIAITSFSIVVIYKQRGN